MEDWKTSCPTQVFYVLCPLHFRLSAKDKTAVRALRVFLLVATATSLVAAPPEPIQKSVKLLGLGEGIDREFAKLTDIGITPSLGYSSVFQGNPVGGIQQRNAYSHLLLFGAELNFDKLICLPGASLTISGAEAIGKNLSENIGNVNTVSEAFVTPLTVLFYELYWKQMLLDDKLELRLGRMTAEYHLHRFLHLRCRSAEASMATPRAFWSTPLLPVRQTQPGRGQPRSRSRKKFTLKPASTKRATSG
jgi:carbohydrate-selective porin OprB